MNSHRLMPAYLIHFVIIIIEYRKTRLSTTYTKFSNLLAHLIYVLLT